jgi:glutaredoxin
MYIIYGTPTCGYCQAAKKLLDYHFIEYEYKDVTITGSGYIDEYKILFPGKTSVPQIMHGNHYVGGYDQLVEYLNNGKRN